MYIVFTYFVSLIVIVISVFITLVFKNELERMFHEEKDVFPFHICNVLITLMVSFGAHAVMTIFILENEIKMIPQFVILMLIILPIYIVGHFAFEKYKSVYRKYVPSEEGKVLVLNERYLKKKKWFTKFKNYNEISKGK
ncbi:hypothetical protein [Fredinandcohnia quinoae]|uniref:Uncharacterized protein n=1 Tax=Fredinandcohnia quinoae TaxID=2918902 RepID=A0AAW5E4R3_9BACI|nr:hypothetical protein [Fredinandcohnia sp. SECRCQ15]MCH1627488.1 hypothetical protein [Fredinandcohnia sp. SECRCQ15]